ncbi:MAG: DegT/DnrJ/EryC1/StrS family aminotransferase [Oscillospiraceae bacterium]|nr:DegT/DnrJ/EryC1/StrS family aminotransferase [Oscillospiraceae bacterium]
MSTLVTRSSMPPFEEYCEEIRGLWDSHWLTNMGRLHQQLEADLKSYLGCKELALFTNGHLALENVIEAFGLHGEIITTPFTFASTTHAIVRSGCEPVFCDIDPDTYTLDPTKLEALITERTCAVLPVHVYGNLCDTEAIGEIARRHGLPVIYDAAHSFGVFRDGISSACLGDAAMFSFHATKVFHTIEGGAVCCRSEELQRRLCDLKNFGIHDEENVPYVGGNAKMNEFCAAMGICNLRHLENEIEKRRQVAACYDRRLAGVEGIRLCPKQTEVKPNYAYYPVVFDGFRLSRDEIFERLAAEDIHARKYFYPLTSSFACYAGRKGFDPELTPVAAHMADRVLTLPMYADLEPETVEKICDIILR